MSGRVRRAAKGGQGRAVKGGQAAAKKKSAKKAPSCSLVFQTAHVARITEWLGCLDSFHLGWSSAGAWREVQATLAVLDLKRLDGVINTGDLKSIVRRFPALHTLNLQTSIISNSSIRGLSSLRNLRKLDVSGCPAIDAKGLKTLPKNLETLRVGNWKNEEEDADSIVIAAARRCTRLRSLYIACCKKNLTDAAIMEIANKCVDLERFKLSFAEITDEAIIHLSQKCDLKEVEIGSCKNLTDASVLALTKNCPRLKKLDISSIKALTNASILALSRFDSLQCLNLNRVENVTDSSIIPFVTRRGLHLLELDLGGTCVTDASVRAVAAHCGMMRTAKLGSGYWVDSARSCTDAAVCALASGCPNLREVHLTSDAITDASVSGVRSTSALFSNELS